MLVLLTGTAFKKGPDMNEVRELYKQATIHESVCHKLMDILKPYNPEDNPLMAGYKACCFMLMAKYSVNPFKKWSYFKSGKKLLSEAIDKDKSDVELRFLRFMIQTTAPPFLGYQDAIEKDKNFLLESLPAIKDKSLKKWMISYMEHTSFLSEKGKKRL